MGCVRSTTQTDVPHDVRTMIMVLALNKDGYALGTSLPVCRYVPGTLTHSISCEQSTKTHTYEVPGTDVSGMLLSYQAHTTPPRWGQSDTHPFSPLELAFTIYGTVDCMV